MSQNGARRVAEAFHSETDTSDSDEDMTRPQSTDPLGLVPLQPRRPIPLRAIPPVAAQPPIPLLDFTQTPVVCIKYPNTHGAVMEGMYELMSVHPTVNAQGIPMPNQLVLTPVMQQRVALPTPVQMMPQQRPPAIQAMPARRVEPTNSPRNLLPLISKPKNAKGPPAATTSRPDESTVVQRTPNPIPQPSTSKKVWTIAVQFWNLYGLF